MRWLGFLLVLFGLFSGSGAQAQLRDTPGDVQLDGTGGRMSLPPAPDGFVRRTAGTLVFEMPEAAEPTMQPVLDTAATEWLRITTDLGAPIDETLLVRIGRNPEEMAALAPPEAPPPAYAVGVAYPEVDLVVLTLTAPETWERPELREVFSHELAHVALHRAVQDGEIPRSLPRWFDEGVAVHEAGERSMERVEVLWQGTVGDALIPLDELDGFPSRPHAVNLAYAESADFVAWLVRRHEDGPEQLRQLLSRVRGGLAFEPAVALTFSTSLGQLEEEWKTALHERYTLAPLLLGGGLAWVLIGVLVVLAFRKKRLTSKRVLQRWSEEERIEDEREALRARAREILRARQQLAQAEAPQPQPPAGASAVGPEPPEPDVPLDDEPPPPKPEIPTIEYEGDRHTLH